MKTNENNLQKTVVFNYLRDRRFGKDALTQDQATEVINNDQICELVYKHIEQLREVHDGKCAFNK